MSGMVWPDGTPLIPSDSCHVCTIGGYDRERYGRNLAHDQLCVTLAEPWLVRRRTSLRTRFTLWCWEPCLGTDAGTECAEGSGRCQWLYVPHNAPCGWGSDVLWLVRTGWKGIVG